MDEPVIESFYVEPGQLKNTFTKILKNYSFNCNFGNLKRDVNRLEEQFYQQVSRLTDDVFEIQVINTPLCLR
jgi:isocitrate dehydrogenase kinase/phosphatase